MSKLYYRYQKLRNSDNHTPNTLYLFKTGLFFIFIDEDAKIASKLLNLKLSNLNETIVKCGFPCNSLQKYLTLLKSTPYNIEMVSYDVQEALINSNNYLSNKQLEIMADEILKLKIDDLSVSQAYDFLYKIQDKLRTIK